jgi:hypothetical protein
MARRKRGPNRFNKRELVRAAKAAAAAGYPVSRIEVDPKTGKIVVVVGKPGTEPMTNGNQNPLDRWMAQKCA